MTVEIAPRLTERHQSRDVALAATALVPADVTMALDRFLEILYP
ncbi:hypothetical protein ACFRH4_27195 [Streptomyces mirabilis]